ncbi:MAG: HAD family hydrolase [Magnetococcales bacterium]|nr:HAD family hydrolase [Magnetococcales bacterium]
MSKAILVVFSGEAMHRSRKGPNKSFKTNKRVNMFVFLDIGFTLIGGPPVGPARRLLEALHLPATTKTALTDLLFRTCFFHADQLADAIQTQFGTPPELTRQVSQTLWQAQHEEAYILPGAAEFLQTLQENQIPFGFISNIWAPFHAGFARLFPVESQTRPSFLSFQLGCAKPSLSLYRIALAHLGIPPAQAIMIGDTYQMDIAPPRQLGIKTVWVLHRPQQELADTIQTLNGRSPPPDLTVADIGQVQVDHLYTLLEQRADHA